MNHLSSRVFISCLLIFVYCFSYSQRSGVINRTATSITGRGVLDPNGDGYSSAGTSGFNGDDLANSEIPYKTVQSYSIEPFGDLRRGPAHLYSDFVPDGSNVGFYTYFSGVNLLFRARLGSVMPGSKGYSILMDTDGRFGASGPNADPNFMATTTGTNGNPGFEIEIVLETNSRIAIYNVDGTSSPVLITSYPNWQDMSQVSIAASTDGGDPDFFIDFYVPFSALQAAPFNLTTASALRLAPTTVMSPQAAIGGPKSDIYGVSDLAYKIPADQYEAFIEAQPPFTLLNLTSGGPGLGPVCTAPPVVNQPIGTGTVSISGSWSASGLSGAVTTSAITVYKNGISVGTVNAVTSGAVWTLNNIPVANGDIITATAQAAGESMCMSGNSVTVAGCAPANSSSVAGSAFSVICVNNRRGMSGTKVANAIVKIYSIAAGSAPTLLATDGTPVSPSGFNITYNGISSPAATVWEYNGSNNSGSTDPCSGGPNDIANGSYYFTVTESGKCESVPVWGSCVNLTATTTPVINQSQLYIGNMTISGTAVAGSTVRLYVNGSLRSSQTATAGGVYSFSNTTLNLNDLVEIIAQATGSCISAVVSRTVSCFTASPLINTDNGNQVTAGLPLTGISSEAAGTLLRVYNSPGPVLVATTPVQADGTWSTANAGTTPAAYNAIAATSYYATAQNGSCSVSSNSGIVSAANGTPAARCGTITGPVTASAGSVSGTLSGSFTTTAVNLYLDGILIGSASTSNTNWGPLTVNSTINNTLYPNGVLTIGIQETGKQEVLCASSATTITCSPLPAGPTYTPANSSIPVNGTITYTISNAQAGTFYGIADGTTGSSYSQGVWATSNGSLSITTNTFTSPGNYNIVLKSTSLSGVSVCSSNSSSASLSVSSSLPLTLISFNGYQADERINLAWKTENEINTSQFQIERGADGFNFGRIGAVDAAGSGDHAYAFTDNAMQSGVNYYRLKMIDGDGQFSYSKVILFRSGNTINDEWKLWPNPVKNILSVSRSGSSAAVINVYNSYGQKVITQPVFNFTSDINFSGLPSGLYSLQIISEGRTIIKKIIKK